MLNFKEWLVQQNEFANAPQNPLSGYSNGMPKPTPDLQAAANDLIAQSKPGSYQQVQTQPAGVQRDSKVMDMVKSRYPLMNPNLRKQFPIGDLMKAVGDSMGKPSAPQAPGTVQR